MTHKSAVTFKSLIESVPMISSAFREGLKAIERKDASKIKADDSRKLSGSVYLDESLKDVFPNESRWDYIVGFEEKAYFAEIHPACTSNVDEVVRKKMWLESWLNSHAPNLKKSMAAENYYWIASGKIAILKNTPQARRIAKNKLVLCKELNLKCRIG